MKPLVAIMTVGRENKHHNRIFIDTVHKTVFFGDASTPTAFRLPFQWFGMSSICSGMLHQLYKKFGQFLECIWFSVLKQLHIFVKKSVEIDRYGSGWSVSKLQHCVRAAYTI